MIGTFLHRITYECNKEMRFLSSHAGYSNVSNRNNMLITRRNFVRFINIRTTYIKWYKIDYNFKKMRFFKY